MGVDLIETLRSTGAAREFRPDPVPDDVLARVLDTARFAPSGGNRQAWHLVVVQDRDKRQRLRDIYLDTWYEYLAQGAAGLVAWAPVTDRDAEAAAVAKADEMRQLAAAGPGGFAEHFDEVPVLLVLLADLRALAAIDRDLPRYTLAGGASIYPFAWSILLAAREEGLGGVITTMAIGREADTKALFDVPDEYAVAAVIALGYPTKQVTKLRRQSVAEFATVDSFDGQPFG
ncbi:MAG: nitroreductase family protein [Actinobacteria bacterium]|nr:nitroreductase family protein [Actinomycetota bacterium]MBV9933396.1 nitroreductase family protein [Actinomycetota bacterium]